MTNGLILTNHHVVEGESSNGYMNNDALAFIAVPPADLRGEAMIKYFGVIVKDRCRHWTWRLCRSSAWSMTPKRRCQRILGLPAIEFGNSDDLMIGDEINMFGYPGHRRQHADLYQRHCRRLFG